MRSPLRRRGGLLAVPAVLLAVLAPSAGAHVQVLPARVAPGDPVQFDIIVPNERDVATTKVEVQVPDGVLPFSFSQTPGWKRQSVTADNGEVESIVWSGSLPAEGFVRFEVLAGTPDVAGEIQWKALQTYADGEVARWIGDPGSESPAPVVTVDEDAPRQNAGGEGAGAEPGAAVREGVAVDAPRGGVEPSRKPDVLARVAAVAALAVALLALVIVLIRGRMARSTVERPHPDA